MFPTGILLKKRISNTKKQCCCSDHRVVSNREFKWTKKIFTQLFDMKFHRGGNEC